MKRFLKEIFHILVPHLVFILLALIVRELAPHFKLSIQNQRVFVFVLLGLGVLFVASVSITGILDDKTGSHEDWIKANRNIKGRLLGLLIGFSTITPFVLISVLYVYFFGRTFSGQMCLIYLGVVLAVSIVKVLLSRKKLAEAD